MTSDFRCLTRLPAFLVGAALVLLVGAPAPLGAQSQATTGIIRGVVTDPSGVPVANAQVILHETQTNFNRTLSTDPAGNFAGTLLPLGTYDATARAVGFAEVKQTGIVLRVGETVPLRLALAAVTLPAVTVEATQSVVDVTKAEASTPLPAQVVTGLPNNGRNYINLTLLTPNVAVVQGPDGDELTVAGQRGIHNNVSVDGADFNNSFFGEQRGGQRPAFTFNLDAVQELVVVAGGANAEFGRSSGGFVNVITKSGTNETKGTLHYFGKYDWLSANLTHGAQTLAPDFRQHQFGFTLGGPLAKDKAFFFLAYDQQVYDDVKQKGRPQSPQLDSLKSFLAARYPELANDFGPIARTNDARAALAKFDFRLSDRHNLSLKYNYTWAEQQNGTFDVDTWGASANGLEKSKSNAVNGSLVSFLSSRTSNELRFQFSREDRPRPYTGPANHRGDTTGVSSIFGAAVPFHDTDIDTTRAFRVGLPFFLPIRDDHDTRVQLLDNVSYSSGNHLIKLGGEWNRTSTTQVFVGFAGGRMAFTTVHGFENFVTQGSHYIECASPDTSGVFLGNACPGGGRITGPVSLYLQQSGVGTHTVEEAGTQTLTQNELAVFLQDTWKPSAKLTLNYGLRWEAQLEPDPITPPSQVFFHPWIGATVTNATGSYTFPSDGTIPSDKSMWQPRLGIAWDPNADRQQVVRFDAGLYYARIPALNLASVRSTNGSLGQTLFGSSATIGGLFPLPPPAFDSLLPLSTGTPFKPTVYVVDRNFQNPRTLNLTVGYERQIASDLAASISYTHARTDHLTRFINRNDPIFGSPFGSGPAGIGTLFTVESSAKSRYNAVTVGVKRVLDPNLQFALNYTLSFDKSDDDNERDPFTFRYAQVDSLGKEYNWSDRDQRHRFNGWLLSRIAGFYVNNRVSYYSAQPASETCVNNQPSGIRATSPAQRVCTDKHILLRNTIRKDNAYFSWDLRISRPFPAGSRQLEVMVEIFNVTNADNFRDPAAGTNYLNFDGTIRSGLGDPRQLQAGVRWLF
jgi:hypothetical protein